MKANELMIFDWVLQDDNICKNRPCQITGMFDHVVVEVSGGRVPLHQSHIKPIPLTAEILKRNGFEIRQSLTYWNSYRILIDKETDHYLFLEHHFHSDYVKIIWQHASGHDDSMVVVLNHCAVHQLQHALKLCGINKEIVV